MPLSTRLFRFAAVATLCVAALSAPIFAARPEAPVAARDTRPLRAATRADTTAPAGATPPSSGAGALRTAAALAGVLGVIFVGAALFKRFVARNPSLAASLGASGRAPAGILEIIGRYPVGRGASLVLLRLDTRVLLLSQTTSPGGRGILRAGGASLATLCEVTGADDVASILAKARDDEGESLAARFQSLLSSVNDGPDDAEPAATSTPPSADAHADHPHVVVRSAAWPAVRGGAA